jgi:hypothetical protein
MLFHKACAKCAVCQCNITSSNFVLTKADLALASTAVVGDKGDEHFLVCKKDYSELVSNKRSGLIEGLVVVKEGQASSGETARSDLNDGTTSNANQDKETCGAGIAACKSERSSLENPSEPKRRSSSTGQSSAQRIKKYDMTRTLTSTSTCACCNDTVRIRTHTK